MLLYNFFINKEAFMTITKFLLFACGAFYFLLCIFSIVTGLIYASGKKKLNPLELSDKFVKRLNTKDKLNRFTIKMGYVTIIVGLVQGLSAFALFKGHSTVLYFIALGFTLFSICSVLIKLKGKTNSFSMIKLIFYTAILVILLLTSSRSYFMDNTCKTSSNTIYHAKFNNTVIKIDRLDYSLGQNQIVGVIKGKNGSCKNQTRDTVEVSMEPIIKFLDENNGFIISKKDLDKRNNYLGIKVTFDGGKTFKNAKINYDNKNIDFLTVKKPPYKKNNKLFLKCSIYELNKNKDGYQNTILLFKSIDNGLSWSL